VRTLARGARRKVERGGFLPAVFLPLEQAGIRARRGTAMIVAAPPGHMKTALVLYWIARLNLGTLYFSADAEDFEMTERAGAMVSGDTQRQVQANPEKYADLLEQLNIRLVYEDAPTYRDLELEVAAYAEAHGKFPEVIVIDNLMNLVGENDDEWGSMRDSTKAIHRLTRITGAWMVVLHHMGEDKADQTKPQPRTKLQGKVSQLAKVVLSLAFDGDGELKVAPVKNRFGRGDASGSTYVSIYVRPEIHQFYNSRADLQMGRPA